MKSFVSLFTMLMMVVLGTTQTYSQDSGFYVGFSLQGTSWTMPDFDLDAETGGGAGLTAGYNFNTNFAAFFSIDGSTIDPDMGDSYALAHADLGVEGRLGDSESKLRPYGRLSYLGMAAIQEDPSGDVEISGAGFGLGGGLYYFVSPKVALNVGLVKSWIDISEVKVGSIAVEVDEKAETGRFIFGLSYHF